MPDCRFKTIYNPDYRTQVHALQNELRLAVMNIEDDLSCDPNKYPSRLTEVEPNTLIYKHDDPVIEITYRIDREKETLEFIHVALPQLAVRKQLFISYSHEDREWMFELKKWLNQLENQGIIGIWADTDIQAGQEWKKRIDEELSAAKVAVLLISVDFLNSDFISTVELPKLLDGARERGLQVLWIAVRQSPVEDTPISKYQAVHKEPPLAKLKKPQREDCYKDIYTKIKKLVSESH